MIVGPKILRVLCFVFLWIDLLAIGMFWDATNLVGLVNLHFPCIYLTLCNFITTLNWVNLRFLCGTILGVLHGVAWVQHHNIYGQRLELSTFLP